MLFGELPTICGRGTNQNVKGYKTLWSGYKLHLDINGICQPASLFSLSALQPGGYSADQNNQQKDNYLHDLMDAAYDARLTEETSRRSDHIAIVDRNGRGEEAVPVVPYEAKRYKI